MCCNSPSHLRVGTLDERRGNSRHGVNRVYPSSIVILSFVSAALHLDPPPRPSPSPLSLSLLFESLFVYPCLSWLANNLPLRGRTNASCCSSSFRPYLGRRSWLLHAGHLANSQLSARTRVCIYVYGRERRLPLRGSLCTYLNAFLCLSFAERLLRYVL